ncbi:MAG: SDR family NAD(P)-dependent oxidoreductase [Pseudomonadales bacterium]|nr:SDR family NAD(P)-dependent oxidoreductase [Pseudomonadales bacterium]
MTEMNGKVAIVTSAARGLGRAYAIHLAKHGAQVVAGDISDCSDGVAEIEYNGGETLRIHLGAKRWPRREREPQLNPL